MAEVLELAKLVEHHRVADVNVRSRRVKAELAAQGAAGRLRAGELLLELALNEEGVRAAGDELHGLADVIRHGVGLGLSGFLCHLA